MLVYKMSKLYDVFLSYSRKDEKVMERVKKDLQESNYRVWTDEGIKTGTESWTQAIQDAIESAHSLVVILSPSSKKSKWVNEEINYASNQEVKIYVILAKGDEKTSVPFGLSRHQWVDIRQKYDISELIKQLKTQLKQESSQDKPASIPSQPPLSKSPIAKPPERSLPKPAQSRKLSQDLLKNSTPQRNNRISGLSNTGKILQSPDTSQNKVSNTTTSSGSSIIETSFSWSFSLASIVLILIVTLSPQLSNLVQQYGGNFLGIPAQLYIVPVFILLGLNAAFGTHQIENELFVWLLGIVCSVIWFVIFLGLLPDSWLGLVSLLMMFILASTALVISILLFDEWGIMTSYYFEDSIVVIIGISMLCGLALVFMLGIYGILQTLLITYLDGFWLDAASVVGAIAIPILLGFIVFMIADMTEDNFVGIMLAFLLPIVSFGALVWMYWFEGWQLFVSSVPVA